MRKNRYVVDFVGNSLSVSKANATEREPPKNELSGTIESDSSGAMKYVPHSEYADFDAFFAQFVDDVANMGLTRKNTEKVIKLCKDLTGQNKQLCESVLKRESNLGAQAVLTKTTDYIYQKLSNVENSCRLKIFMKSKQEYVAPIEKSIGLKWRTVLSSESDLPDHRYVNTTFQFVPISKTLSAKFSDSDFKKTFLEYNKNYKHECKDSVYRDFCCGKTFRDLAIPNDENTAWLEIGMDEFDACCALKSKATIHKVLAIYFRIRNMPPQFASRLNNIYLVALCESINFKDKGVDSVIDEIVRDLMHLEENGIDIGVGSQLKVHLTVPCSDNLGANQILGFSGSFSATYYCRLCEHSKTQCQKLVQIDPTKMRKAESYENQIQTLDSDPNIDLKKNKGVQKKCSFNQLKSYFVLSNITIDLMHDILEGVVPFFLRHFFTYCTSQKICTEEELVRRIRDYTYGTLNSRNKPSKLKMKKKNLGQNASQLYCIITHLPFIFCDKLDELIELIPILQSLLKIMRVIFSNTISSADIDFLDKNIKIHLSETLKLFKVNLIPKHHNLVHYPYVIRSIGPIIKFWMMRYEAKHKFFTTLAKQTNNFVNISKTLAERHQEIICGKNDTYKDEIIKSKNQFPITKSGEFNNYKSFLSKEKSLKIDELTVLNFVKINGILYKKGLMVIDDTKICEIVYVLQDKSGFLLVCRIYNFVEFDTVFNSMKIEKSSELNILNVSKLLNHETHEKKICRNSIYLLANNLDVYNKPENVF